MKRIFKQTFFCLIFLSGFLVWGNADAACTGSSPTWTAADCSEGEVSACINAASSGDTVTIPAGDCLGTPWTTGVTIPSGKNITIQGAGYNNTIIGHGNITVFNLNGTSTRITGLQFKRMPADEGKTLGAVRARGIGWRIDHNWFNNNDSTVDYPNSDHEYIAIEADNPMSTTFISGLIDNNIIFGRIDLNGSTFGVASTEWNAASRLGTANAVYIEDNIFKRTDLEHANVVDAARGVSYVARYNTIGGATLGGHAQFMTHGLIADGMRGTKNFEIYGNNLYADDYYWMPPVTLRGGTGVVLVNISNDKYADGNDAPNIGIQMYDQRAANSCSGTCTYVGFCDGTGGLIDVDGTEANGHRCRDQIGTGSDVSVWATYTSTPDDPPTSAPAYYLLNRIGTVLIDTKWVYQVRSGSTDHIQANRDYYGEGTSFDGISGVGYGTLDNRPATCTTGVAYWVTNDDYANIGTYTGANWSYQSTTARTKNISGSLYKCTDTDTWEEYYTPYTYPHPLRTEAYDIVAPASPTGLAVT